MTNSLKPIIKAILVMGGRGDRFGSTRPKQFHLLSGKPVYLYALETLQASLAFSKIIIVCPEGWKEAVFKETASFQDSIQIVNGGSTRQHSCYLGLQQAFPCDYVLIHDAVRPLLTHEIINKNISSVLQHKAINTICPVSDTIVYLDPTKRFIQNIPNRSFCFQGQTPQTFAYSLIVNAHNRALKSKVFNASDDCQLVLGIGHPVHTVNGSEQNIKITNAIDLYIAEHLLRTNRPIRDIDLSGKFLGKVFVITGGTGGIGKEICRLLERYGATAIPISTTSHYKANLQSAREAKKVFHQIYKKYGLIDGLINSIGYLKKSHLADLSIEEIQKGIGINFSSVIYSCKFARIKPRGHIVNLASSAYFRGRRECTIYSGSKAAIVNFTQALAEEVPNLFINAVIPQRTNTSLRKKNFPLEDPSQLLSPEQVASSTLSVLLQDKDTGTVIEIKKWDVMDSNHRPVH